MKRLNLAFAARVLAAGLAADSLVGCGVTPDAARMAQQESALLGVDPGDDAGVRQALVAQADAWTSLSKLLETKQFGGVQVGEDFRAQVQEICQLTARQRALIEAGEDDVAANRAMLAHLKSMWDAAGHYLTN